METMWGQLLALIVLTSTYVVCTSVSSPKRLLVVGGSGRVGGSAVRALYQRYKDVMQVDVGGRTQAAWLEFQARQRQSLDGVNFVPMDVYNKADLDRIIPDYDVIVNTAGPFQGLETSPTLNSALKYGKKYVDVCDDVALSRICRSSELQDRATETGAQAVISAGIWPGGSSLLAQEVIEKAGGRENVESVKFYFHTAGSGNAGKTILTATFLILGEEVLTYVDGDPVYFKSATNPKTIDFGKSIGMREVVRFNLIECESCYQSGIQNVETYFGTAPPFWNTLFAGMANVVPGPLLQNRQAMAALAQFSLPVVRLIDGFVGAKNGIKVEVKAKNGKVSSGLLTHMDMEKAVGDALASFVAQMIDSDVDIPPGVYFPEEVPSDAFRQNILKDIASDAITYSVRTQPGL